MGDPWRNGEGLQGQQVLGEHPHPLNKPGHRFLLPATPGAPQGAQAPCTGTGFCREPLSTISPPPHPQLISLNMFQLMQFGLTSSSIKHSSCQPNMKDTEKTAAQVPQWWFGRGSTMPAAPVHCRGQAIPSAPRDTDGACLRLGANNTGAEG